MKQIIFALFAVIALGATPALSANNIVQKDDGTTAWESTKNDGQKVYIGPGAVSVSISPLSNENTSYVVMPFAGIIKKVYSVLHGAAQTGAANNVTVWIGPSGGNNAFTQVTDGSAPLIIAQNSSRGTVDSWTPNAASTSEFASGEVIAIQTDGGGTDADTRATFTIVVAPK